MKDTFRAEPAEPTKTAVATQILTSHVLNHGQDYLGIAVIDPFRSS